MASISITNLVREVLRNGLRLRVGSQERMSRVLGPARWTQTRHFAPAPFGLGTGPSEPEQVLLLVSLDRHLIALVASQHQDPIARLFPIKTDVAERLI